MNLSVAQQSNPGGRNYNEDSCGVFLRKDAVLLVIADGLGGHDGGKFASSLLVKQLGAAFKSANSDRLSDASNFFTSSIAEAHMAIQRTAGEQGFAATAPKTTVVICLIRDGVAQWAHSGDSRLYLIRKRKIIQRTSDQLSKKKDDAGNRRLSHCVGGVTPPRPLIGKPQKLEVADTIVLATDGAWQKFSSEDIREYVEPEYPCLGLDSLLQALEKRNKAPSDNLSMVVLFWGVTQADKPIFD